MKKQTIFPVVLFAILSFGFSQTADAQKNHRKAEAYKNQTAPNDKALVYFVRPQIVGGVIGMGIYANGTRIGKTKGKNYLYGFFEPGEYTFMSKAENKAELFMTLEPGKIYFIKQEALMGITIARTALSQVSEQTGREYLQKCNLSKKQGVTDIAFN